MTKGMEWLMRYLKSQFTGVRYTCDHKEQTITVTDCKGESLTFSYNMYGDILDCTTEPPKLVATSDCTHDWETMRADEEPTAWRNNPAYFG